MLRFRENAKRERWSYDPRALLWQTVVTCAAVALAFGFTDPSKNINWVFGPGKEPQQAIAPLLYVAIELAAIIVLVLVPMHFLLRRLFAMSSRTASH